MDYEDKACKINGCTNILKLRNGERVLVMGYCAVHYERQYKGLDIDGLNQKHIKYGQSKHPLYRVWTSMRQRCSDPNAVSYKNYGARGVTVCDRWQGLYGFKNFLDDMGERPTDKHSIERIDNDGNYCPENCRWASVKEQSSNRRSNVWITIFGETKTVSQWAKEYGMKRTTLSQRISVYGWGIERALTTPVRERG